MRERNKPVEKGVGGGGGRPVLSDFGCAGAAARLDARAGLVGTAALSGVGAVHGGAAGVGCGPPGAPSAAREHGRPSAAGGGGGGQMDPVNGAAAAEAAKLRNPIHASIGLLLGGSGPCRIVLGLQ